MKSTLTIALCFFASVSLFTLASADDPDQIETPVATADFVVTVTDESDKPIKGVKVRATGLRVKESPGSHYGWPTKNVGKAPTVMTDATGKASFKVPEKFGRHPDWVHTTVITYLLEHPEFISRRVETQAAAAPVTEIMVPGCELIVSAVDPQRQMIDDLGVLIAGNQPKFVDGESPGELRSRSIPQGRRQTMLVRADRANGRHLFSGVLGLRFAESKKVSLRGLALKPGLEIQGTLSENVTRPVKNGVVLSWSIPKPDGPVHANENASIGWRDVAEIQADGSFHFPSLPKFGKLQLIAICDGWVIDGRKPGDFFTRGNLHNLDEKDFAEGVWDDLVLPMTPTATIEVTVQTPDGKPLPGAQLGASPNQLFEMSGSQLLGDIYTSADFINQDWSRAKRHPLCKTRERYESKTNEQGIGLLRDIPMGNKSFYVRHGDYQVPFPEDANENLADDRGVKVLLDQAGTKKVVVTVEPIPRRDK